MKRLSLLIVLVSLAVLAVACAAPTTAPTGVPTAVPAATKAPTAAPAAATTIILPDGTTCLFAGKGATLAFDGKHLNYTCGTTNDVGLLGNMTKAGTGYTVERATLARKDNAWTLAKSETITMEIATMELADGTACANAGKGATLSFDGKRLNYTCTPTEIGVIGDLQITSEVFMAERAAIARENNAWALKASALMPIRVLRAAP